MKSLAARYYGPKDLRLETIDIPTVQEGEVLIRVRRVGVCATDLRIYQVGSSAVRPPVVLGHEVAGEVVEVGDDATQLKKHDRVCVIPDVYCGRCPQCKSGSENLCVNVMSLGYNLNGAYSEYLKLPSIFMEKGLVCKIPPQMSFEEAALIEPLACCFHGLTRSGVGVGKTTLVVGDGPIGLMHVLLAKLMGSTVGVAGLIERNLALATSLGADFVINASKEDTANRIDQETAARGVNVIMIAVSLPQVIQQAIHLSSKKSAVVIFGGCPPHSTINVDTNLIHYGEVSVTGSSGYTYSEYKIVFDSVARKQIGLEKLVTHHFKLSEIMEAFNADIRGEAIKAIVDA